MHGLGPVTQIISQLTKDHNPMSKEEGFTHMLGVRSRYLKIYNGYNGTKGIPTDPIEIVFRGEYWEAWIATHYPGEEGKRKLLEEQTEAMKKLL